jgi:3-deoxy-D-manno-octulosonic-acid transferase
MLYVYNLLLLLALPFVPIKLLWRSLKQPAYKLFWGERFGKYATTFTKPVLWLHCVSVGETRAAEPLVNLLLAQYPNYQILITHGTPTGRDTSQQLFGDNVAVAYLPYDLPFAVSKFLNHFKPTLGMIMETEIWFNLINACHKQNIPLMLLNARMSPKSAERYAKVRQLTRSALQSFNLIAAQSYDDVLRFQSLGAENAMLCGNFKFDVIIPENSNADGQALRHLLNTNRPIFVAGSTREGEEELILDAIEGLDILTIIVPRHPQRFDEVEVLLTTRHISHKLKTDISTFIPKDTKVVLGNTMGELFTYYAASDFTFVGGSLKKFGGQNIIEPASLGKPILMGKYTYNFAEASKSAVKVGAATQVKDALDFKKKLETLSTQPTLRDKMSAAAITFSQSNTGATQRALKEIAKYLTPPNPSLNAQEPIAQTDSSTHNPQPLDASFDEPIDQKN